MSLTICEKGIRKLKIPYKSSDLTDSEVCRKVLRNCLVDILNLHFENADKEADLEAYYKGTQDIRFKLRKFESQSDEQGNGNAQICENHALAQVDFLTDYLLSERVKLSSKDSELIDDTSVLETFLNDANFYTEIREVKKDMFMVGVGVSYSAPRTDIIENDGKYTKYKGSYNKDKESPFTFAHLDPKLNFVIYSSYAGEEPLFAVNITNLAVGNNLPKYEVRIWSKDFIFTSKVNEVSTNDVISLVIQGNFTKATNSLGALPIIEHTCNKERLGVIEINRDDYNLVNMVKSIGVDAVYDEVNKIFVFENVEIDGSQFDDMIANKCITINSVGIDTNKPNVYTIEVKFDQSDVNVLVTETIQRMYDIVGVPLASANTSTGITGTGQRYGGGWETAEIKMNGRITGMQASDYDMLKLLLKICKLVPKTKINELYASEIEISYRLSMNDNILSKTQSASNLYAIHVPLELILKYCRLSNDISNDTKKWEKSVEEYNKQQEEKVQKQQDIAQTKADQQEKAKQDKGINQNGVKDIKSE